MHALALAVLISCTKTEPEAVPPPVVGEEADFKRRLRLGLEQLRHHLPESAAAEFEKCARIRPDDPELLFQQARLKLFSKSNPDVPGAIANLKKAVASNAVTVKANRLLANLAFAAGDRGAFEAHCDAVERAYGQIGETEMNTYLAYLKREGGRSLKLPRYRPEAPRASDFREMLAALGKLRRQGGYEPTAAVPSLEKSMQSYGDLAVIRLFYAKKLLELQVRVNYSDQPGLPPMSSKLILDYAQSHLEKVHDQEHPDSSLAHEAIYLLSRVALAMADYDEVLTLTDILLDLPGIQGPFRRRLLGQKGLARYKQGRHSEAISVLEKSLEGLTASFSEELSHLWLLHLAHEQHETPPDERKKTFRFRKSLPLRGAQSPLVYEDVAPELRINKLDGLGPSAWADYDRDGDFDLYVSGCDSYGALYRNDGKLFTDVSRQAGLFHNRSGYSATFADYDNDGWPDLYVGRDGWSGPARNSLYRNNGDGTFTEVASRAGVDDPGSSFVHSWSDVDRDGDLDLYVVNGITGSGDTNTFYRNNGDGTFADVTVQAGLQEPKGTRSIGAAFGDYDRDGLPDLFVSGYATANRLYRNKGGGEFAEVAKEARVDGSDQINNGYVCFFVDYDNDTHPDILKTSLAPWNDVLLALSERYDSLSERQRRRLLKNGPKLYRNNRDGTFTDVSVAAGLVHPIGIMGANVADLDNDGYVDFYFGTGNPRVERMEPDRFYRNNADGTFTDLTFATGLGNVGKGHGVTFVDLDGDGALEIYAPEGGFVHGDAWPNAFYRNRQTLRNHWLHVDLEGVESNRDAVDVQLLLTAGNLKLLREVKNGVGFGSSDSPTVEFGLGEVEQIDHLEVRWPSGAVQTLEDLPVDRRVFVREGEPWR